MDQTASLPAVPAEHSAEVLGTSIEPQMLGNPARSTWLGHLRGAVNLVDRRRVAGWAQDTARPEEPVRLEILVGGVVVAAVLADRYREELRRAGVGNGAHGFEAALPPDCETGALEVRRAADRAVLDTWPSGVTGRGWSLPSLE